MEAISAKNVDERIADFSSMMDEVIRHQDLTPATEGKWTWRWLSKYKDLLKMVNIPHWAIEPITSDDDAYKFFWSCCVNYVCQINSRGSWIDYPIPDCHIQKFGCRWLQIQLMTEKDGTEWVRVLRSDVIKKR